MDLPAGWLTDIAVLRLSGALVQDRGDHLVVTDPGNPGYHWGNFVLVTDPQARNDAQRWVDLFQETFPDAHHMGIGLPDEPDPEPWAAFELTVGCDMVMSTTALPEQRGAPAGYSVEQLLSAQQWGAAARADLTEYARTGGDRDAGAYRDFTAARVRTRTALSVAGVAAFFGAFVGEECVSQLGIVLCGADSQGRAVARYQSVETAFDHRNRGLAGHLLGVAATWAADRGARRWVIATEPDNPAGRLYRSLGFVEDSRCWQVERT